MTRLEQIKVRSHGAEMVSVKPDVEWLIEKLESAIAVLEKVNTISESPEFNGVFTVAHVHGLHYSGGEYGTAVREFLERMKK